MRGYDGRGSRGVTRLHTGKIKLPTLVGNGTVPKTALPLADTIYYQVGPQGDYVQEGH